MTESFLIDSFCTLTPIVVRNLLDSRQSIIHLSIIHFVVNSGIQAFESRMRKTELARHLSVRTKSNQQGFFYPTASYSRWAWQLGFRFMLRCLARASKKNG